MIIVTIDGTSASGKTSAARSLAQQLGFALLRTGAMYRALALAADRAGFHDHTSPAELEPLLPQWIIDADEEHVFLNQQDVSKLIDGNKMSHLSSTFAEWPCVRRHITQFIRLRAQQYLAQGRSFVAEGRDQGSYVFPEADCKFFIDADVRTRAERRLKDLHHREDWSKTTEQLMEELTQRDHRDRNRAVAPLCIPDHAMQIDTTTMSKEEVVTLLVAAVLSCRERRS